MSLRSQMRYMNPYDVHKALINEYVLKRPGDTRHLQRDASRDKTDYDVLRDNHKFLWETDNVPDSWELQFAKKYYDKLFKEYCIGDLTRYKENKIALRWRTEQEVVVGKGQFTCANKKCQEKDSLRTWEVNFAYQENGEKKNALVKIRLCASCSEKLNHHTKKREIKRLKHRKHRRVPNNAGEDSECKNEASTSILPSTSNVSTSASDAHNPEQAGESPWDSFKIVEAKTRDEEMEDYLQDLLL